MSGVSNICIPSLSRIPSCSLRESGIFLGWNWRVTLTTKKKMSKISAWMAAIFGILVLWLGKRSIRYYFQKLAGFMRSFLIRHIGPSSATLRSQKVIEDAEKLGLNPCTNSVCILDSEYRSSGLRHMVLSSAVSYAYLKYLMPYIQVSTRTEVWIFDFEICFFSRNTSNLRK